MKHKTYIVGNIICFQGAIAIDRITGKITRRLREFVVTKSGTLKIMSFYPAMIDKGRYRNIVRKPKLLKVVKCR